MNGGRALKRAGGRRNAATCVGCAHDVSRVKTFEFKAQRTVFAPEVCRASLRLRDKVWGGLRDLDAFKIKTCGATDLCRNSTDVESQASEGLKGEFPEFKWWVIFTTVSGLA